ncbi:MAG: hypothetical protein OER12_04650 [Acidimicrobiia bacterium]|nr:hypothetical protein [Acidimicrobiia bacterium]
MFWFGRPPLLRWMGAALLVVAAAVVEFWPSATVTHPFTASDTAAGDRLDVEWRAVPAGLLVQPPLTGMVASHAMKRGEPITPSDVEAPIAVPAGWWALAVELPIPVAPGSETRLVLGEGPTVAGLVVAISEPDPFDISGPTALMAVPGEDAGRVAAAVAARELVVLVAP